MASAVETNIRLFHQRRSLYVRVHRARLAGPHLSAQNAEKVCIKLASEFGLVAVVVPGSGSSELLIAGAQQVPEIAVEVSDLSFTLSDTGEPVSKITLTSPDGERILPLLLERAMVRTLMRSEFWSFDSTRLWYEQEPFETVDGVAAYRRYRIGAVPLDDEGVGMLVDVQTAFFSTQSLAWFFDRKISREEQERRRRRFEILSLRQEDQKGTLLYTIGHKHVKCYFVEAPGRTCDETGTFTVQGVKYESLTDYYRRSYPSLKFDPRGEAVLVSFVGLDGKPKWVAAELLRLRVMNDALPRQLSSPSISPADRRHLIDGFWSRLGDRPFGPVAPGPESAFWLPDNDRVKQLPLPTLCFGKSSLLNAPEHQSQRAYRRHYSERLEYLDELGCWRVAPDMPRVLYFAYPDGVNPVAVEQFASAVVQKISNWTGREVRAAPLVSYHSIHNAKQQLQQQTDRGVAIVVLDSEGSSYYEVAYQLDRWRVKRLTPRSLERHYDGLTRGRNNRWDSFVALNALGVLQLLDAHPYVCQDNQDYEAQLFIDVGYSRRDFVVALLIAREEDKQPSFDMASLTVPKPGTDRESINARILTDSIVKLVRERLWGRSDPLSSLLVERDGRFCGDEAQAITEAVDELRQARKIAADADIGFLEIRKTSQKPVRLWQVDQYGTVSNPLEGTALRLNTRTLVIASTGCATLRQGTASPIMLAGDGFPNDIHRAGRAVFAATQLNWSNPRIAQRLPIHVRNSDVALQERAAQLVRGFR